MASNPVRSQNCVYQFAPLALEVVVGTEVGELVGTGVGEPVGWESVKWSARESSSRRCSRRGSVAVGLGGSVGPLLWICRGSAVGCVRE